MATQGWVKLHRKIMDNDLWKDRPFARGQAWIDLIMLANHEEKEVWPYGECVTVPRGSHITSIRKLAERWGWSRTKVKRFLNELESAQMLIANSDNKKTIITITNYQEYQGNRASSDDSKKATKKDTKKPLKDIKKAAERHQKSTNNNELKNVEKKRKKEPASPISSNEDPAAAPDDDDDFDFENIVWDDPASMTEEEAERWIHDGHL